MKLDGSVRWVLGVIEFLKIMQKVQDFEYLSCDAVFNQKDGDPDNFGEEYWTRFMQFCKQRQKNC